MTVEHASGYQRVTSGPVSAAETWLIVAAVVAGVAALLALLAPPAVPARVATALHAAAVGLVAVGLVLALP